MSLRNASLVCPCFAGRLWPVQARALTLALALTSGCVSEQTIARNLVNAARPSRLPAVVACWEKEFEEADFSGRFVATVNFVVEAETSKIRDGQVVALDPSRETPARDASAFKACIEGALNRSSLPLETDKDGPGFRTSSDLTVRNYRIEFVDESSAKRRLASARQSHVLIGPRADRCQGLYSHDPPRDASTLYSEIAAAEARAARAKDDEPSVYARELQKAYDAKLELRARTTSDLTDPLIPEANKKRQRKALNELEASIRKEGMVIGCTPPVRSP